jgi:hypothetical protein
MTVVTEDLEEWILVGDEVQVRAMVARQPGSAETALGVIPDGAINNQRGGGYVRVSEGAGELDETLYVIRGDGDIEFNR